MAKKKKRVFTIQEQVGDTTGFEEVNREFTKDRKLTTYLGLFGIVALVVFAAVFFITPTKVFFNSGSIAKTLSYTVDRDTGLLEEYPSYSDLAELQQYYYFEGWYFQPNMKGECLTETDLQSYEFNKLINTTLYGKWIPVTYDVTYVYAPEDQFPGKDTSFLESINKECRSYYEGIKECSNGILPTYTIIKHELNAYEEKEYLDVLNQYYLPTVQGLSVQQLQKNLMEMVNIYKERALYSQRTLSPVDTGRFKNLTPYKFIGWFDEEGNEVESLSQTNPKSITLYAHYEKR